MPLNIWKYRYNSNISFFYQSNFVKYTKMRSVTLAYFETSQSVEIFLITSLKVIL